MKGQRVGFPSTLCGFKKNDHPRSTLFTSMHSSGRMVATTWFDSKPVQFLNTSVNLAGPGIAMRWLNSMQERVSTTPQQVEYQEHMDEVDKVDQMRRDYTCQFWSRKWWHKLLFFVLDSSKQNAWALYLRDRLDRGARRRLLS
jgi:hypothetical protein